MNNKYLVKLGQGIRACVLCGAVLSVPLFTTGCGGQADALQLRVGELEERIRELERHNGRVGVKVDDLEDQFALLTDRVETNRLAMARRGQARSLPMLKVYPDGSSVPSPPPVQYDAPKRLSEAPGRAVSDAGVNKRIQVPVPGAGRERQPVFQEEAPAPIDTGGAGEEHVVITEDDYKEFVQEYGVDDAAPKGPSRPVRRAAGVSRPRNPRAPVTDETLAVVPTDGPAAPTVESRSKMDIYKSGLSKYRSGDYSAALREFRSYLDKGPESDYLDNAYYWLGECSFGLGQYNQAIGYFNKVLNETPGGNKVPDSMLKASLAYVRLGKTSEAKSILYNLIETYPSTNAAKLATQKINKLD